MQTTYSIVVIYTRLKFAILGFEIFFKEIMTPPPPHKNKTTRNPIKSNLNRGQNSKEGYITPQHDSIVNILDKNYEVKVIGFA